MQRSMCACFFSSGATCSMDSPALAAGFSPDSFTLRTAAAAGPVYVFDMTADRLSVAAQG